MLYDRALVDIKKGRHEVGRLNLQTLINTYPDSEYLAKAKLAIADSYYKEGGTANLTQAIAGLQRFHRVLPFPAGSAVRADSSGDDALQADGKAGSRPDGSERQPRKSSRRSWRNIRKIRWLRRRSSTCAKCRKCWPKATFASATTTT